VWPERHSFKEERESPAMLMMSVWEVKVLKEVRGSGSHDERVKACAKIVKVSSLCLIHICEFRMYMYTHSEFLMRQVKLKGSLY